MRSRQRLVQLPLLLAVLGAIQFTPPGSCLGQAATLASGDRIRVKPLIRPKDRVTGSFIAVAEDSLSFEVRDDVRRLALTDIKTLEVSTGEGSHIAGTLLGGVTGAGVGAAIGAAIERGTTDYCVDYCGLGGAALGFVVGGIGGLFAGYHWLADEGWADVAIGGLQVGVGPGMIQFQIGL